LEFIKKNIIYYISINFFEKTNFNRKLRITSGVHRPRGVRMEAIDD
jgi:hypothetical protein